MDSFLKYKCAHCGNSMSLNLLGKHLRNMHSSKNNSYPCGETDCFRRYGNLCDLKKHLSRDHTLEPTIGTIDHSVPRLDEGTSSSFIQINQDTSLNADFDDELMNESDNELQSNESDDDDHNININYDEKLVLDQLISLSLNFHGRSYLPRNVVQEFLSESVDLILKTYNEIIKNNFENIELQKLKKIEIEFKKSFKSISSESKLIKKLIENDVYIRPKVDTIDVQMGMRLPCGIPTMQEKSESISYVPLKETLKKVLEMPRVYENIKKNLENLKKPTSKTNHLMQGKLWKSKLSKLPPENGFIYLAYVLYFDDWEPNNPLGSHKKTGSMCGCYMQLPFLPSDSNSKLENIFLVSIFKSSLKKLGMNKCLCHLIEQIRELETQGIKITINDEDFLIKPVLALVIGDNLAINEILGYTTSFSANYPCRFCKIKKNALHVATVEDPSLLRNAENYEIDLALNNVTETGVVGPCAISKVDSFEVWENRCPDIMHDMLEGTFNYDLSHVLHYLMNEANYFTLNTLNIRKENFDYGYTEYGNISEKITDDHIKKRKFDMSASEMMCFIKYLPLIIADLVPEEDDVWEFFSTCLKIFELVCKYEVSPSDILHLNNLVKSHNEFYVAQFKDTLKPKHHFMVHYGTSIEWVGPLRPLWCMRFEGENRTKKLYAGSITSRRNLALSICRKEQLKFAGRLISKKGFEVDINAGPKINGSKISPEMEAIRNSLSKPFNFVKWISLNSIRFQRDCVLHIGYEEKVYNEPILCLLKGCLYLDTKNIFLIVEKSLHDIHYSNHYHCYVTKKNRK